MALRVGGDGRHPFDQRGTARFDGDAGHHGTVVSFTTPAIPLACANTNRWKRHDDCPRQHQTACTLRISLLVDSTKTKAQKNTLPLHAVKQMRRILPPSRSALRRDNPCGGPCLNGSKTVKRSCPGRVSCAPGDGHRMEQRSAPGVDRPSRSRKTLRRSSTVNVCRAPADGPAPSA